MRRLANHILALMATLMALVTYFLSNEAFLLLVYGIGLTVVAYFYFIILYNIRNLCLQFCETKLNDKLEKAKEIVNNIIKEIYNEETKINNKTYGLAKRYCTRPTRRKS